jgi:competence protein ComEC
VKNPMAWLGIGVVLGALAWPGWQPAAASCALAIVATASLMWWAPSRRTLLLCWAFGGLYLGSLTCALRPEAMSNARAEHIVGEVSRANTRWTEVRTEQGLVLLKAGWQGPPVGAHIAAWTSPIPPEPVLPGARDPSTNDARTGAVRRRLRAWLILDGDKRSDKDERKDAFWSLAQHGGLLRSLATGKRDRIDKRTRTLMIRTGTVHLIAISGLHVGLVAVSTWGLAAFLLRPLVLLGWVWTPRALSMGVGLGAASAYAHNVGWPASAQRALWMVAAVMLAKLIGRRAHPFNLLGAAATLTVLWNPGLVGELGFQLSFTAVAGILLWAPWLAVHAPRSGPRRWLLSSVGATVGATIGTLPFAAWDFQLLAPSAILANLIAAPTIGTIAVPAALVATHAPAPLNLIALSLGDSAVDFAVTLLDIIHVNPWTPAVGPLGAMVLGVAALLSRRPWLAIGLAVACLTSSPSVTKHLTVIFPAVGQGSAVLVRWPDGRNWLIDGGPKPWAVLHWLRRQGIRQLDTVFLTHPQADHMRGIESVIDQLNVKQLVASSRPKKRHGSFHDLWRQAAQRGVSLLTQHAALIHPPAVWTPGAKPGTNDQSLVLRIQHGTHSFLLTGDIEAEGEAMVLDRLGPTTVVQVPHHGSKTSSGPDFVARLAPRWAVVPVGASNRYGHPAPEVIARWGPARVLRTDIDGTVRFTSDGTSLEVSRWTSTTGWVQVDRPPLAPPQNPLTGN